MMIESTSAQNDPYKYKKKGFLNGKDFRIR